MQELPPSRARFRSFSDPRLAGDALVALDVGTLPISKAHDLAAGVPFRPLPRPTGLPPFHLRLQDVLPPEAMQAITAAGHIVFQIVGDTGGIRDPHPQLAVAALMEAEFRAPDAGARPAFLYLLGDVVYFYGDADEYYPQFYEPYLHYPAPVFAVPGNHDGNVRHDGEPSLVAFVENFCAPVPHRTREAEDVPRDAMTQPYVYWTLEAPFVTIVGLYTNVPEGGRLDEGQINWLHAELAHAPADRALLVTMHHPIYSGDDHHSGSAYMGTVLDEAIHRAGRVPDAVLAGHVHNYQRFTRTLNNRQVPYIVAGAGGYYNLHHMLRPGGQAVEAPVDFAGRDVSLARFCDDRHGYLRLEVAAHTLKGAYYAAAGSGQRPAAATRPVDSFTLDLQTHRLHP